MISKQCLNDEWVVNLRKSRSEMRKVDPGQLEVAIRALDVLCRLQLSGLPFLFKGGTSLLLHLPEFRRLSVDVDIVCTVSRSDFERVLTEIVETGPYTEWEEDVRGTNRLPRRRHYNLYFPTHRSAHKRQRVVVDVLEEACPISDLVEKPIITTFLEVEEEVRVRLPSVNALLGDKLTAFAPHTVGVRLNERYAQQVAKQMFDVGELFLAADDLAAVKQAYVENQRVESAYRDSKPSFEKSLRDTRDTAYEFCHYGLKKDPDRVPEDRALLLKGIGQMQGLLVGTRFNTLEARVHASRAARLADAIQRELSFNMEDLRYNADRDLETLHGCVLPEEHRVLQRLTVQPEALLHWKHILVG